MRHRDGIERPRETNRTLFGRRIVALAVTLSLLLYTLLLRAYEIQVVSGDELARLAEAQQSEKVVIAEPRGRILDRNGESLLREGWGYGAAVFPSSVADALEVARFLRPQSPPEQKVIVEKIEAGKPFLVSLDPADIKEFTAGVSVKGGRSNARSQSVVPGSGRGWGGCVDGKVDEKEAAFGTPVLGVVLVRIPERIGVGSLTSSLIGFYDPVGRKGLTGVERAMDSWLRGAGSRAVYRFTDGGGKPLEGLGYVVREETTFRGHDVMLTVDYRVQRVTEDALKKWVRRGAAVVMDAETGEVLAAAGVPSERTAENMWMRRYDAGFLVDVLRRWVKTAANEEEALRILAASCLCGPAYEHHDEKSIEGLICEGEQVTHPSAAEWRAAFAGKCTITISPVQIAQFFAMMMNQGETVRPWYVRAIRDENGTLVLDRKESNMKTGNIVERCVVGALLKAVKETANRRYGETSLSFVNGKTSWCVGWLGCRQQGISFRNLVLITVGESSPDTGTTLGGSASAFREMLSNIKRMF